MEHITGVAQHYDWGSTRHIPDALGLPVDERPWAEWWLGTHPGGPARLSTGELLVDRCGPLPYLVKLLAAARPLSLQTHPSAAEAAAGFDREDVAGVPIGDPRRTYRDRLAKPEILVALTDFDALTGFRPLAATRALLDRIGADELSRSLDELGLADTVARLYRRQIPTVQVLRACRDHASPEAVLVSRLAMMYPSDPSVVVTLLLNHVTLTPGQAVYLTPGNLHVYLHGFGVEVMGASDNVLRGGMTTKHVDVEALLATLDYTPLADPVIDTAEVGPGEFDYLAPGAPFQVRRVDVVADYASTAKGDEIWLVLREGEPAETWFVADGTVGHTHGPATLFRTAPGPNPA